MNPKSSRIFSINLNYSLITFRNPSTNIKALWHSFNLYSKDIKSSNIFFFPTKPLKTCERLIFVLFSLSLMIFVIKIWFDEQKNCQINFRLQICNLKSYLAYNLDSRKNWIPRKTEFTLKIMNRVIIFSSELNQKDLNK